MIVLALEEFAAKRRTKQADVEKMLHPYVARALDGKVNTDGYREVIEAVRAAWNQTYGEESGREKAQVPAEFVDVVRDTLAKTDRPRSDETTVTTIATWLATAIVNHATLAAAADDEETLVLEWVDMNDTKVRHSHHIANGQRVLPGEPFEVGGHQMPYPGYPGVPFELWINCRCAVRPDLAGQEESRIAAKGATVTEFKDYDAEARKKVPTQPGTDGAYPIADCEDLKNAIQAIGRSKDPAATKRWIRSRKSALGCPDVELPDTWAAEFSGGWWSPSELDYEIERAEAAGEKFLLTVLRSLRASMAERVPDESSQPGDPSPESGDPYAGVTHAGLAVQAADTGRVLMLQRSLDPADNPEVQGTWEFPGGSLAEGEDPEAGARREWAEETGCAVPDGVITGGWRNGNYQGFVLTVDMEREACAVNTGTSEVDNPDDTTRERPEPCAWFSLEQMQAMGPALRPEVYDTDWTQFSAAGGDHHYSEPEPEEEQMDEPTAKEQVAQLLAGLEEHEREQAMSILAAGGTAVPWHGVLTIEGKKSGDGRGFRANAMRTRPLPLPLSWQKVSAEGHGQAVTVARIDRQARVPAPYGFEVRGSGYMLQTPEADEVIGLLGEFGRFGVSVDADDATMEMDDESDAVWFSDARSAGACIVGIPAFHEAWVALGEPPEDFYDGAEDLATDDDLERDEALVAAAGIPEAQMFVDIAPGLTEDGPGWLTHPVDTDRLRDYWTHGEGAAKINWGVPGDFDRCRALLAEYVKPQYLSGYCANRHFDALKKWPGQELSAAITLNLTEAPADIINIVAAAPYGNIKAPADWFRMEEPDHLVPWTITEEGQVFGHIAGWNVCHKNVGQYGRCFLAPRSPSSYSHFLMGETHLDDGTSIPTGRMSIGGGHANLRAGLIPAIEHYDSTSTGYASVTVKDGEHGIWACGWVVPGTPEEMVVTARATPPSGDWRNTPHGPDMVAALHVNVPGYETPRVAAHLQGGQVMALVAAGMVMPETEGAAELDLDQLALAVALKVDEIQQNRSVIAALDNRFSTEKETV